jgi:myo-inositol-1(or 4)-monophosphatase
VFDAIHEELFHAVAGEGAFLNGNRIHVNARESHKGALLASSAPPFINHSAEVIQRTAASMAIGLTDAGAVRNLGPTSLQLAYVACGRLDAFWEYGEDTFNCLGGSLLVREAGGLATDAQGAVYAPLAMSIVAAGPSVHASLSARLSGI